MKYIDREVLRFILAGVLNTALGYGLYCGLLLVSTYPVAYTISYVAGIFISYILNCMFVFRTRPSMRSAVRYPLIYVVQYVFGITLVTVLVRGVGLDPRIAALVVLCFSVPLTYVLSRLVIKRTSAECVRAEL